MRLLAFFSLATLLTGCASLTRHERHQFVLVRSEPEGASIVVNDRTVGTTPRYVELRRSRAPQIFLRLGAEEISVNFGTRYGWGQSFFPNLVFFYGAPIGWGTDLVTGAAWNLESAPVARFGRARSIHRASPPKTVAIAPPQYDNEVVANAVADFWGERLKAAHPQKTFRDYGETFGLFRQFSDDDPELFAKLDVTEVFESKIDDQNGRSWATGRFRNVFTGATAEPEGVDVTNIAAQSAGTVPWYARTTGFFFVVPNTVSLEWASSETELEAGGREHTARPSASPITASRFPTSRPSRVRSSSTSPWPVATDLNLASKKAPIISIST